jgi:hypothetical protein
MPALGGAISALLRKKPKRTSVIKLGLQILVSRLSIRSRWSRLLPTNSRRAPREGGLDRRIVVVMDKCAEQAQAVVDCIIQPGYAGIGGRVTRSDGYEIVRDNIVGRCLACRVSWARESGREFSGRRIDGVGGMTFPGNGVLPDGL